MKVLVWRRQGRETGGDHRHSLPATIADHLSIYIIHFGKIQGILNRFDIVVHLILWKHASSGAVHRSVGAPVLLHLSSCRILQNHLASWFSVHPLHFVAYPWSVKDSRSHGDPTETEIKHNTDEGFHKLPLSRQHLRLQKHLKGEGKGEISLYVKTIWSWKSCRLM